LSADFIKILYSKYRSALTHNSILGKNARMIPNNKAIINYNFVGKAFFRMPNPVDGGNTYMISLKELHDLCTKAVIEFKKDIDIVVPLSKNGKKFN
jgi:hypothetical protein